MAFETRCIYDYPCFIHTCWLCALSPIHTADATQLSSWVASAVWTHQSSVVTQFPIFCRIVNWVRTADGRVHTADTTQLNRINSQHVQFRNFRRQSSWASCEFNTYRRRVESRRRRRCVLGISVAVKMKCAFLVVRLHTENWHVSCLHEFVVVTYCIFVLIV